MTQWHQMYDRLTLEPIFGSQPGFSPQTGCHDIHPGDIPLGSRCCCMVCHQTGIDHHPKLRITELDKIKIRNWKPPADGDQWSDLDLAEPTVYQPDDGKPETRKERRARERNQPNTRGDDDR